LLLAWADVAGIQPASQPARIRVYLPEAATLEIDGARTSSTGPERLFETPPLPPSRTFVYTLRISGKSGELRFDRMRLAEVRAGAETVIDLRPATDRTSSPVLYVPSPDEVVVKMLEFARVGKDDIVYDLGCGDGRIVIAAARKYGARGVGIDIDPARVKEALALVDREKVGDRVEIRHGDALKIPDLERATVVTLYMLSEFNEKVKPILQQRLKPGTRVVAHDFPLAGWKPVRTALVSDGMFEHELFIYEIEAKKRR
jgi:uncharacterized protein (TIGR03000 family)